MSVEHSRPAPAVVHRWRRFGHDRAYVKVADHQLGYRDLLTGEVSCEDAGHADMVAAATADMVAAATADLLVAATPDAGYAPRHARIEDTGNAPGPSSDHDLAANLPGQAARRQARNWNVGADGEEEVARRLAGLGAGWRVLHAIPVGVRGADIDHLVIGPAGVFTLNAKHHPGANVWVFGDTVKVNGLSKHYVRNSRREAHRAATSLGTAAGFDVDVRGLVVVLGADRGFTVKQQPPDGLVSVVAADDAAGHLRALPPVLGTPSIERIYDVARHVATWLPALPGADPSPR